MTQKNFDTHQKIIMNNDYLIHWRQTAESGILIKIVLMGTLCNLF